MTSHSVKVFSGGFVYYTWTCVCELYLFTASKASTSVWLTSRKTNTQPTVEAQTKYAPSWHHILFIMYVLAACKDNSKAVLVLAHTHTHHITSCHSRFLQQMLTAFFFLFFCFVFTLTNSLSLWVSIWMWRSKGCYSGSLNNSAIPKGKLRIQVSLRAPCDDSNGCHPSVMMIHPWLLPARGSSLTKLIVWHMKHASA